MKRPNFKEDAKVKPWFVILYEYEEYVQHLEQIISKCQKCSNCRKKS